MRLIEFAASLSLLAAAGCGETRLNQLDDAGSPAPDAGVAVAPDAGVAGTPDGGATGAPAWQIARTVLHVHSAISHDACDGHSRQGGTLATFDHVCLAQLKAALCADHIDVALLTDHPAYMQVQTMQDDLLYTGGGEQLVLDASGAPVANRIPCGGGRSVLVSPGYEAPHTMPIGLMRPLSDPALYSTLFDDNQSAQAKKQLIDAIHAAGGLAFSVHSEEPELSAAGIAALGTDGMEWYNVHGNLLTLFGRNLIGGNVDLAHLRTLFDSLGHLEPFLMGGPAAADLVLLDFLASAYPEAGTAKYYDVLAQRRIAGVLGNDVHQNVAVAPLCKGALAAAVCKQAAKAYPNLLTQFLVAGSLTLSDGERVDSYARVLRWLNNRVLVHDLSVDSVRDALAHGRSYGVFAVFGEPGAFAVWADTHSGQIDLGGQGVAAGATLHIRLPDLPAAELGPGWDAAAAATADVHTVLYRVTPAGKSLAAEWHGTGAQVDLPIPGPGSYAVEVLITPHHLTALLGPAASYAGHEYRWILANAITLK